MQQICNPGIVMPHNEQSGKTFLLTAQTRLKLLELQINDFDMFRNLKVLTFTKFRPSKPRTEFTGQSDVWVVTLGSWSQGSSPGSELITTECRGPEPEPLEVLTQDANPSCPVTSLLHWPGENQRHF